MKWYRVRVRLCILFLRYPILNYAWFIATLVLLRIAWPHVHGWTAVLAGVAALLANVPSESLCRAMIETALWPSTEESLVCTRMIISAEDPRRLDPRDKLHGRQIELARELFAYGDERFKDAVVRLLGQSVGEHDGSLASLGLETSSTVPTGGEKKSGYGG